MFSIDLSNKEYYIILKDNKEFTRVNRAVNTLEAVMRFFGINLIKGGGKND